MAGDHAGQGEASVLRKGPVALDRRLQGGQMNYHLTGELGKLFRQVFDVLIFTCTVTKKTSPNMTLEHL